jgi:hypothetical protein
MADRENMSGLQEDFDALWREYMEALQPISRECPEVLTQQLRERFPEYIWNVRIIYHFNDDTEEEIELFHMANAKTGLYIDFQIPGLDGAAEFVKDMARYQFPVYGYLFYSTDSFLVVRLYGGANRSNMTVNMPGQVISRAHREEHPEDEVDWIPPIYKLRNQVRLALD